MDNVSIIRSRIVALFKNKNLTGSAKDVLMVLTGYLNKAKGCAWPSVETLADRTGWSYRTVLRALKAGKELGILHATRRFSSQGRKLVRHSNLYRFVVSACEGVLPGFGKRPSPWRSLFRKVTDWNVKKDNKNISGIEPVDNRAGHRSVAEYLALIETWKTEEATAKA